MKKFISVILVLVVMLSIATVTASANYVPVNNQASVGAVSVSSQSSSAEYRLRLFIVQCLVDNTNARIQRLVNKAIASENPDLDKLVEDTNELAANTMRIANILGIEVQCEYTAYVINGVTVYIDPLIVIKK